MMPSSCRVLIIDDDETFRALCQRYLLRTKSTQYAITMASTVGEALKICEEQTFDCLVIDYRLPDDTGTAFLASLREKYGDQVPPAIVLTAGGGEQAATQAVRVSATDFMTKSDVTRTSMNRAVENAVVKAQLQRSVAERNATLREAYQTLKKNNEEIKQFYHTVSHEVKTPLTALQEFLKLISEEIAGPVSEEQQELLSYALDSCDQIASHFNDLVDVTRLETGKLKLKMQLENPAQLINRCVLGASAAARDKDVELVDNTAEELPDLMLDAHRFVQVLANLISNAIKFTEPGGVVSVESEVDEANQCFYLSVKDTGVGFDPALRERVFDRLFQVVEGAEDEARQGGLGLGLAISRELAQRHGGDIECETAVGQGSTFRITLPLVEAGHQGTEEASKAA